MIKTLVRVFAFLFVAVLLILAGFRANAWWQETYSADQLSPKNGQFVETENGTMHVTVWGEASGKPLLMTHGMAAWGGLWEETAKEMVEKGYRVIALDQPPFGFSDRTKPDFSRSTQADRIGALIEKMGLKDVVLVGHSYGGGIAMEAAMRYPEKLKGVVLVCPVMVLAEKGVVPAQKATPFPLNVTPVAETLVSATITNPLLTGFLTKRFMHQKDALTEKHIDILQRPMQLAGNTKNMVTWLRQFLQGDPGAISRDRTKLAANQLPVSLIWGEEDTVTPIAQGEELAEIIAPLEFQRLKYIGHMPQMEAPSIFNEALTKAIVGIEAAPKRSGLPLGLRGTN